MNRTFLSTRVTELNLDAKTLSEFCGVSEEYMKQILRGYEPSKRTLKLLSQALKCSETDLVSDSAAKAITG